MNNNLNFALYNIFLAIRTSPLQRKCKYKGCASHFGPCSSRKNPFVLLFGSCLRWLTNRSPPGQCYKGSSPASIYPSASADELNFECLLPLCSQFVLYPSIGCRLLHANVLPLFYPGVSGVIWFVSVLPRKVLLHVCVLLCSVCFFFCALPHKHWIYAVLFP